MEPIKRWAPAVIAVGTLVLFIAIMVGLQAETAEAAKPKYAWLSPVDFVPMTDTTTYLNAGGALVGAGTFLARVPLSAGKKMTGLTVYYHDNMSLYNVCATLIVQHAGSGAAPSTLIENVCSSSTSSTGLESTGGTFAMYKLQKNDVAYVTVDIGYSNVNLYLESVAVQYK